MSVRKSWCADGAICLRHSLFPARVEVNEAHRPAHDDDVVGRDIAVCIFGTQHLQCQLVKGPTNTRITTRTTTRTTVCTSAITTRTTVCTSAITTRTTARTTARTAARTTARTIGEVVAKCDALNPPNKERINALLDTSKGGHAQRRDTICPTVDALEARVVAVVALQQKIAVDAPDGAPSGDRVIAHANGLAAYNDLHSRCDMHHISTQRIDDINYRKHM